ncbi:MAG: alcohol dehydrogenase catalytic domain-containing protein [Bacteroidales bacterium]|nr:alcohol dehydrogenase catalytic domain-containing protein [Bacteroidales bacterium]
MKSWVLTGLSRMEMVEKPVPEIGNPGDVLIRMASIGVCGSDIHYYKTGKIGSQVVKYPFTVGHECAGIVEAVGEAVGNLKPGDRVAVDPAMPCYQCDQCRAGRYHTCRNLRFLGCPGQAEGCLSEYIVMPARSCYLLKDNLTLDQGALSEPLAIGVYAVRLSGLAEGAKIGILGTGPIGISVLLPARTMGAGRVYMTDKIDARLSLAGEMGASWTGNPDKTDIVKDIMEQEPGGLDMVFECCGQQEAADQAIRLLKPGGKLMIIGIPEFPRWSFEADDFRRKEISVQNVRRQNEVVALTLDMISGGTIRPDRMQTHTFDFDRADEAFDLVAGYRDGVMKAMINLL